MIYNIYIIINNNLIKYFVFSDFLSLDFLTDYQINDYRYPFPCLILPTINYYLHYNLYFNTFIHTYIIRQIIGLLQSHIDNIDILCVMAYDQRIYFCAANT